jgi:hypothetical protein
MESGYDRLSPIGRGYSETLGPCRTLADVVTSVGASISIAARVDLLHMRQIRLDGAVRTNHRALL